MKPGAIPKIRAELIADATTSVATLDLNPDLVATQPAVAHAQHAIADSLPAAGLFLVAQAMTAAAVDAARDVPPTTLLEVWPEQTAGIMAFEGGLPVLDARGTPVRPEVMTWCHDGHNAYFQLLPDLLTHRADRPDRGRRRPHLVPRGVLPDRPDRAPGPRRLLEPELAALCFFGPGDVDPHDDPDHGRHPSSDRSRPAGWCRRPPRRRPTGQGRRAAPARAQAHPAGRDRPRRPCLPAPLGRPRPLATASTRPRPIRTPHHLGAVVCEGSTRCAVPPRRDRLRLAPLRADVPQPISGAKR